MTTDFDSVYETKILTCRKLKAHFVDKVKVKIKDIVMKMCTLDLNTDHASSQ